MDRSILLEQKEGIFREYALNTVRSGTGDLLVADTEDLKSMPPSEFHVRRVNRGGHSKERQYVRIFHVERAKCCKKNSRCPPLCAKRRATSSNSFQETSTEGEAREDVRCILERLHISESSKNEIL